MNKTPIRKTSKDIDYLDLDQVKPQVLFEFVEKYKDRENIEFNFGGNPDSGYYVDVTEYTMETPEEVEERLERELNSRITNYETNIKYYSKTLEEYKDQLKELQAQKQK